MSVTFAPVETFKPIDVLGEPREGPRYGNWTLPGHGKAYVSCGGFGIKVCPNDMLHADKMVHYLQYSASCARAECPICYETWAAKEAHRSLRRWEHARLQNHVIHVVFSPPASIHLQFESADDYKKIRTFGTSLAKLAGLKGGETFFHPFRWRCFECGLDDERCRCEVKGRGYWYWSPHFHMIAYGWVQGTREIFESKGWVIVNLKRRESVFRTVQYLLSHAGVWMRGEDEGEGILPLEKSKKVNSITWWGCMGFKSLKLPKEPFNDVCPECGAPYQLLAYMGSEGPPELIRMIDRSTGEGRISKVDYLKNVLGEWRVIRQPQGGKSNRVVHPESESNPFA